jgi:cell division transport system permease protein
MFKQIKQMNTEINELIQKNITYYTLSFTTLIFAFLFLNISLISIYNLYENNKKLKNSYPLNVYINNNVSQNNIEKLEKEIMKLEGIEQISYTDKELALKRLSDKLGISSRNINNPLLNSFTIKIRGKDSLNNAKTIIDEMKGVKETIINEKTIDSLDTKIATNNKYILWLFIITFLPIKLMIFNIMHSTVVSQNHDIEAKLYLGLEKKEILRPYYFINNIKFISAATIGGLIFLNLYEFLRDKFTLSPLVAITKVGVIVGVVIIFVSLLFPFISSRILKVKG